MVDAISGATQVLGILADPVRQARTPGLVNAALAQRGHDAVLLPLHVAAPQLADAVAGLRAVRNFRGAVVSMPHKTTIVPLLDQLAPEAVQIGACNTFRREPDGRLVGTTLDGLGFVAGLQDAGIAVAGQSFFLLGAGGAAVAIAFALGQHGAACLTIHNRTAAKAAALAARIRQALPALAISCSERPDPAGHDVVVNATALGMADDDPSPVAARLLEPAMVVAEIVVARDETPLLRAAASRGCRLHYGKAMLAAQIGLILDFIGLPAPART